MKLFTFFALALTGLGSAAGADCPGLFAGKRASTGHIEITHVQAFDGGVLQPQLGSLSPSGTLQFRFEGTEVRDRVRHTPVIDFFNKSFQKVPVEVPFPGAQSSYQRTQYRKLRAEDVSYAQFTSDSKILALSTSRPWGITLVRSDETQGSDSLGLGLGVVSAWTSSAHFAIAQNAGDSYRFIHVSPDDLNHLATTLVAPSDFLKGSRAHGVNEDFRSRDLHGDRIGHPMVRRIYNAAIASVLDLNENVLVLTQDGRAELFKKSDFSSDSKKLRPRRNLRLLTRSKAQKAYRIQALAVSDDKVLLITPREAKLFRVTDKKTRSLSALDLRALELKVIHRVYTDSQNARVYVLASKGEKDSSIHDGYPQKVIVELSVF